MLFLQIGRLLKTLGMSNFETAVNLVWTIWEYTIPSVSDPTGIRYKGISVLVWTDEISELLMDSTGPTYSWENVTLLWISIEVWFESQGNNLPFWMVSVICWLILKKSWSCHLGKISQLKTYLMLIFPRPLGKKAIFEGPNGTINILKLTFYSLCILGTYLTTESNSTPLVLWYRVLACM